VVVAAPQPVAPDPVAESAAAGEVDAAAVRRVWEQVLDALSKRSRTTRALLLDASVTAVTRTELTLCFKAGPLVGIFEKDAHSDNVAAALRDVLGVTWKVKAVFKDDAGDCVDDARAADDAVVSRQPTPIAQAAATEDFAPGDEPADVDDGAAEQAAPRRTEEDPAVALLRSGLGAQVISQRDGD
jgi:DNA polymerase-3 subunit gamma/tau